MQSEHNEHLSATLVKIELGTQNEPLQSQVIVLHRSRGGLLKNTMKTFTDRSYKIGSLRR
uniref:Uncharacterized protein n=1 Tax=Brassica campestris TaxID=3711 RepID=A0A3P5Z8T8_BRACM|nr:unnamed protein product [Brassica rapa]